MAPAIAAIIRKLKAAIMKIMKKKMAK